MIIDKAREWIGTPYHHQQRLKGVGVDCVGLIIAVGLEAGVLTTFSDESFKRFAGYSRSPNPRIMKQAMEKFLTPIDVPHEGAVAWMEMRKGIPQHLGIYSGNDRIIHACGIVGRVIESKIDHEATWWAYV